MRARTFVMAILGCAIAATACQEEATTKPALPSGTITGRVLVDDVPVKDWRVRLEKEGKTLRQIETDIEGRFRFENVPVGAYSLMTYMVTRDHMYGKRVRVEATHGSEQPIDIIIKRGELELEVKLDKALAQEEEGIIYLFGEKMTAGSGVEFYKKRKETLAPAFVKVCGAKEPCFIPRLTSGAYTACLCPLGMSYDRWLAQGPPDETSLKLNPTCEQLKISETPESRILAFKGD